MASELTIQLAMELVGANLDSDPFTPDNLVLTLSADPAQIVRKPLALSTTPATLDSYTITPGFWFVLNTHATKDCIIRWGTQNSLDIKAGHWNLFSAAVDPSGLVAADTGTIFYMCWDA